MSKRAKVVINGKFLRASLEGMPRVAREICLCLDHLLDEPRYAWIDMWLVLPKGGLIPIGLQNIKVRQVGLFKGFLWEQIDLPLYARKCYCLNFTNTAPLMKSNGCVVVHDAQFKSSRSSHDLKSTLLYNIVTPWVARRYRSVVTVSEFARQELRDFDACPRDDIRVIPNGVDHVLRRDRDDRILSQYGLERKGYILANSYIHAHKNVRILLQAMDGEQQCRPLVLFGGSTREEYAARGIHIPPGVIFVGRVSDEELVSLMANARMFLFPSTTEGFGLPPLEAMMLRCPTICARAGAVPANCGDGAWYADPYDAEEWRAKINALWHDEEARDRLAVAGEARAREFRWMDAARAYIDVIAADLSQFARSRGINPFILSAGKHRRLPRRGLNRG